MVERSELDRGEQALYIVAERHSGVGCDGLGRNGSRDDRGPLFLSLLRRDNARPRATGPTRAVHTSLLHISSVIEARAAALYSELLNVASTES